jgi:hypothetical protein
VEVKVKGDNMFTTIAFIIGFVVGWIVNDKFDKIVDFAKKFRKNK